MHHLERSVECPDGCPVGQPNSREETEKTEREHREKREEREMRHRREKRDERSEERAERIVVNHSKWDVMRSVSVGCVCCRVLSTGCLRVFAQHNLCTP